MSLLSRRSFLATGPAFVAGCALKSPWAGAEQARVALQLYSVREYIMGRRRPDGSYPFDGVGVARGFAAVAEIGYTGVEFAGDYGLAPQEIARLLKANGLTACGTHLARSDFAPENIGRTIDFWSAAGCRHLVCSGRGMWPDATWTLGNDEWWRRNVEFYTKAAVTTAAAGCTIGYHSHTNEFARPKGLSDGRFAWEYFFENVPDNVCMEIDVGWATCAGQRLDTWLKRFPGRSPTIHAKENAGCLDEKGERVYGDIFEGILGAPAKFTDGRHVAPVDWDGVLRAADEDGVKWLVVESDRHHGDLTAVTASYAFLKGKGRS